MRRLRPAARRLGVSFVELLVVLSTATVIMTLSSTLIHRILHAQTKACAFFDVERSALRLTSQFRHDVHQATDASIRGEGAQAVLTLPHADSRSVHYRLVDGDVIRVLLVDGAAVSQETFSFPDDTEGTLQEQADPRRLILSLAARSPEAADPGPRVPSARFTIPVRFRVEACLGRGRHPEAESGVGRAESKEKSSEAAAQANGLSDNDELPNDE